VEKSLVSSTVQVVNTCSMAAAAQC